MVGEKTDLRVCYNEFLPDIDTWSGVWIVLVVIRIRTPLHIVSPVERSCFLLLPNIPLNVYIVEKSSLCRKRYGVCAIRTPLPMFAPGVSVVPVKSEAFNLEDIYK